MKKPKDKQADDEAQRMIARGRLGFGTFRFIPAPKKPE